MGLLERAARIQSVLFQMKSAVRGPPVEWQIHSSRHHDSPYSICASWRLSRDAICRPEWKLDTPEQKVKDVNSMHLNDNVKHNSFVTCREEQGWRSGESARLPPMWPGFDSQTGRHMWVEFVVGFLPCSDRFFSVYSGFPLSSKTNIFKFQFHLDYCQALYHEPLARVIAQRHSLCLTWNFHLHLHFLITRCHRACLNTVLFSSLTHRKVFHYIKLSICLFL